MLFNSYVFLLAFLPLVVLVYAPLRAHRSWAIWFLVVASGFFYVYWNPAYLPLLIGSVGVNYAILWAQNQLPQHRGLLLVGLVFNGATLFYFKYAGFILGEINAWFQVAWELPQSKVLPLAISFYTFQQAGVLIDNFYLGRRQISLRNYTFFVVFFPQLIAGPIVRYDDVDSQFEPKVPWAQWCEGFWKGLFLFTLGLAKKVLLADQLWPYAAALFDQTSSYGNLSFIEAWVGTLAYTFQLYFDFSGYSDMAVGLGLMFGFNLPMNFNSPFLAPNIADFWKRWHISLSRWFMAYLYTPMYLSWGKKYFPKFSPYLLSFFTMALVGVWHGAGYTYVFCGLLHGSYLVLYQFTKGWKPWQNLWKRVPAQVICGRLITFVAVIHAMVLFRVHNLNQAVDVIKALWLGNGVGIPYAQFFKYSSWIKAWSWPDYDWIIPRHAFWWLLACGVLIFLCPNSGEWTGLQKKKKRLAWSYQWSHALGSALLLVFCLYFLNQESEFLYFQF